MKTYPRNLVRSTRPSLFQHCLKGKHREAFLQCVSFSMFGRLNKTHLFEEKNVTTAKYINILKVDSKSSFSKKERHRVVSIYNFLLRKWTKYILSPLCTLHTTILQLQLFSRSLFIHKAVLLTHSSNLGSENHLYLKKQPPTHKTLRCPYGLSKSKLNQRGT